MEVFNTSYMGAIFKTARKRAGLTQEQVAEQVDITPRFLMGLEKGEKRPSLEVLLRLAHLLNIPGDALSILSCLLSIKKTKNSSGCSWS